MKTLSRWNLLWLIAGILSVPGSVVAADAPANAAPKAAADAAPLFDGKTLKGWTATDFAGRGEVEVEDGAMVLEPGNNLTGVNYSGKFPESNYELELEARRITGTDFFCGVTLPVGAAHFTLVVGGWGGSLVGISSIDGRDASENDTKQNRRFEQNRWYKIRVRVTAEKIQVWIDAEQVVDLALAGKKISMRGGEIELSAPVGISSFLTKAAVRAITLRKL